MADKKLVEFYSNLIRETASGKLKIILEKNNISVSPVHVSELKTVPVFSGDEGYSLLDLVSSRTPTQVHFPRVSSFRYVPAYYKRYRDTTKPRGYRCDIVITEENYCWTRLFIAKELMHCSIDDDGVPATNSFEKVNQLIAELSANYIVSPEAIVDEVAWEGALRYTIPDSWLPLLRVLHKDYCAAKAGAESEAYIHLAHILRVPTAALKIRMASAS